MTLLAVSRVQAQESSLIAIGRVNAAGVLVASQTTFGPEASVSASTSSKGLYTVTVDIGTNEFFSTNKDNYVVEVMNASATTGDVAVTGDVTSVTSSILTIGVATNDVEDSAGSDIVAVLKDSDFFFAIHSIRGSEEGPVSSSPFTAAMGTVGADGSLESFHGEGGIVVSAERTGDGRYLFSLEKTGEFAGDSPIDYVLIANVAEFHEERDMVARGDVFNVATNDEVVFVVNTDDVEDSTNLDTQVGEDSRFSFIVYRLTDPTGVPRNHEIIRASIDGDNGDLVSQASLIGATGIGGRTGEGVYLLTIDLPEDYPELERSDILATASITNRFFATDRIAFYGLGQVTDGRITIVLYTNDSENGSNGGVAIDQDIYVSVYSITPAPLEGEQRFQPDLQVGKKLSSLRGTGVYDAEATGQTERVKLSGPKKSKHFLQLENDGIIEDSLVLTGSRLGRKVKAKYFRISGGRTNVTAALTRGGVVEVGVAPGQSIQYEAQIKKGKSAKKFKQVVKYLASSVSDPIKVDAVQAKVISKK